MPLTEANFNLSTATMEWKNCQQAFHVDGSYRDIMIFDTNIEDWDKFLIFVKNYPCKLRYVSDGELCPIPPCVSAIFEDIEHNNSLSIDIEGIIIMVHFFWELEIELDIDPSEVNSQRQLDNFANFVSSLGREIIKDVVVTEENCEDEIWFKYVVESDDFVFQLPNWVVKKQSEQQA